MASQNQLTDFELDGVSGGDSQAIQNMGVMPPGGDIAEMCFIVLMNATNDQNKDLQLIVSGNRHARRR